MYPRLIINVEKYRHNVKYIHSLCKNKGISLMAVTKVFCADTRLVQVLNDIGVDYIADSRIENLANIDTKIPKVLLRIPSVHELESIIKHANISLNSELETIIELDKTANKLNTTHAIILMIDIGDLREGMYYTENILEAIKIISNLKNIQLIGIGTNLTCFGGIIPTEETLQKLFRIIDLTQKMENVTFSIVSGGNSSHLHLLFKDTKIEKINNLRVGEALILGRETAFGKAIENLYQDVVTLEADLIEIKQKPSIPEGDIGMNAFGEIPQFENLGLMKRGIIALGRQDVDYHELIPQDEGIRLIGASSDHIILDLTHAHKDYSVGDTLLFKLTYGSLLSLMTSKYVRRDYIEKL